MRFLLLPTYRNRQNFSKKGRNNATLILFVYPVYSLRCTSQGIYDSVGYLFLSSSFCVVFGDTRYVMSATSLYAFLVWYNQAQFINADFGRLVGTLIVLDMRRLLVMFGLCISTWSYAHDDFIKNHKDFTANEMGEFFFPDSSLLCKGNAKVISCLYDKNEELVGFGILSKELELEKELNVSIPQEGVKIYERKIGTYWTENWRDIRHGGYTLSAVFEHQGL